MQSKGIIRSFTIILIVVCIYQLMFTFFASQVEKDAKAYAKGDAALETAYLDSMKSVEVYPIFGHTYKKCQENQINLGLDLKGGMNVTLEISVVDLIKNLANNSKDPLFLQSIATAQEMQKNSQDDFVTIFGQAFKKVNPNGKLSSIFMTRELQGKVTYESTNEQVLDVIREQADLAISNAFNVLRKRVDKFGVAQPNIQKLETAGRILVELPGVKDKDRVRKLLQGTAQLEFWETYENSELSNDFVEANKIIKESQSSKTVKDTTKTAKIETKEKSGFGDLAASMAKSDSLNADSASSLSFSKENPLFSILQPNIYQTEQGYFNAPGPVVGLALIKDTAKVNEYLSRNAVKSVFPRDAKFLWTVQSSKTGDNILRLVAIKVNSRNGKAPLEGDVISDARQDYGQSGSPVVSMTMNPTGTKIWKRMTRDNAPKDINNPESRGRSVAVVLDDAVYSFPEVRGEIPTGQTQISGGFSIEEAQDLANVLKAGKLPAPARIVEEAIVGPSLGAEAIRAGILSLIISLLIVMAYMVFYYNKAGWVSVVALFINIFLVMGVLASIGSTLTLAGIAGIVLTIGMSVDANVLIFERVREELRAGSALRKAIDDGYSNANSSIIDANVTTLLTGIILFIFGSGPIQGFATTLIIGILTSLFSAILVTRVIFMVMLGKDKVITFSTGMTENVFNNINWDYIKNRKIFYIFSGLIVAFGIFSLSTKKLNLGVDFTGGRTYTVRFDKPANIDGLRKSLAGSLGSAEVKTFGDNNQVKVITKYLIDEQGAEVDSKVETALKQGLSNVNGNFEIMSSQKIGPTIADDIKKNAFWAILFSLIVIFLYIVARFSNIKNANGKNFGLKFAAGAVLALGHDVIIVLAVFSIFYGILPFSLELDQAFIAAILTVVGFSINDTVVVFDRIREDLGIGKKQEIEGVINGALNSTLSRTINTSLTVFFVVLAIFVFGGDTIRGFSFALLIGIIVGTYSSLCIATPIMYDLIKKSINKK